MSLWLLIASLFAPSIAQLGSEVFATREAASGTLKRAGWLAIPALRQGMLSTDREVSSRCERLLRRYPPSVDLHILGIVFRSGGWVAGCEVHHLRPDDVDSCLRRWRLFALTGEPWPSAWNDWNEYEQMRASLNFARMRAKQPSLPWPSVPWSACLEPESR